MKEFLGEPGAEPLGLGLPIWVGDLVEQPVAGYSGSPSFLQSSRAEAGQSQI
jgi:hypothetical protein